MLYVLREISRAVPVWPWISSFRRSLSSRDSAPKMQISVLLNSLDNLFVTPPSIASGNGVLYSSCDLKTFVFCASLLLRCCSQFSFLRAAKVRWYPRDTFFYRKIQNSDQTELLFMRKINSVLVMVVVVGKNKISLVNIIRTIKNVSCIFISPIYTFFQQ